MRGELETEQNGNILTPTLMAITAFLSRYPGLLNRGPGPPPCWVLVLSTASYLQLTRTSCARSYIIIWRPLLFLQASRFQFNPSTVKVISWYSSTGCICYLHRCISYFDSSAGSEVNMQHEQIVRHPNFRSLRKRKVTLDLALLILRPIFEPPGDKKEAILPELTIILIQ